MNIQYLSAIITEWLAKETEFHNLIANNKEIFLTQLLKLSVELFDQRPPYFSKEITPALTHCISYFSNFFVNSNIESFEKAMNEVDIHCILAIMGMRMTSASVINTNLKIPSVDTLVQVATQQYNEHLTVSAKALSKHAWRDPIYWGMIQGSPNQINAFAKDTVIRLINESTWWNIYGHFKFGSIYEIRVVDGHGARWTGDGSKFIGFVEPEDKNSGQRFSKL